MAYLCPVCEDPQADAQHLANHLAFTALLGNSDHGDWLDERVPDWAERDDDGLASELVEHVDSVEHPIDDVETHDHDGHDHEHGGHAGQQDSSVAGDALRSADRGPAAMDAEAQEIVAEAREMTREMQAESENGDDEGQTHGGDSTEGETE